MTQRYNTSHQAVAVKQQNRNYRPDGAIAAHVLTETVYIDSTTSVLHINGSYWVASSKFAFRYYRVTVDESGAWSCSASDERVARNCKAQVQAYLVRKAS